MTSTLTVEPSREVAEAEDLIASVPLHELYARKRRKHANARAASDGETTLTYAQLDNAIDHVAQKLIEAGVSIGDRVSLMAPPGIDFLLTYLATVSVGGVWLGLNPRYTSSELTHIIADAQPSLILEGTSLNDEEKAALRDAAQGKTVTFANFTGTDLASVKDLEPATLSEELLLRRRSIPVSTPAALFYTSGTTGKPKGAIANAAALARIAVVQSAQYHLDQPATIANLPINHTGCVGDIVSVIQYAGGYLHFLEGFDVDETIAAIEHDDLNLLFQIPTQLIALASHPRFSDIVSRHIDMVAWGGAALPLPLVKLLSDLGPRLLIGYGSSEVVASLSITPLDSTLEQLTNTVGVPDPSFDMHLLPDGGQPIPVADAAGVKGEILVKHWTFLPEYLNNPEATADVYTEDGYLKMGDVGFIREDGYLSLVGRTKEMFKSGGYNVYPKEVESALEEHPLVWHAAVVKRSDATYSEVGVAFIQLTSKNPSLNYSRELKAHCSSLLANYKVPKNFVIVDSLPTLPNGKIDKLSLQAEAERFSDLNG